MQIGGDYRHHLSASCDEPGALEILESGFELVDNCLTLYQPNLVAFYDHGQAQSPLMRESR